MKNTKVIMPIEANAIWKKVVKVIPHLSKGIWNRDYNNSGVFLFSSFATRMQIVFITKKAAKENDYLPGFSACDENGNYFDGTMDSIKIIRGLKKGLKKELNDHLDEIEFTDLPYQIGKLVDNIGKIEAQKYLMKLLK